MPVKPSKYRLSPLRIAAIYALIGGLWIVFSDTFLAALVADKTVITRISIYKGWAYVAVTAGLLYWLIRRYAEKQKGVLEALQEREERLSSVIEQSPIGIAFSRDGITLDANSVYLSMFGYAGIEELRGKPLIDQIAPQCRPEILDRIRQRAQGQMIETSYETIGLRKDGSEFPFFVSVNRVVLSDGPVTISFFIDITARKKAEEKIRQSEHNLAEAERIGNTGSWDYDVASDTAAWSENMFRIFDVDQAMPRELVFKHFVENIVHPDDRTHIFSVFQDALTGKRPYDLEYRVVKRDGNIRNIHALAETFRDEQGKAVRMIGKVEDITERKKAEEALRQSHERLRRFVDSNIVGIAIASPSGGIIETNDYYLRLIGYTREEFEQGLVDWRATTPPEWLPADEQAIKELHERGICMPYEKEYVRRDGSRVSVFLSDAMLPGPEEQIAAFVLDITERKRAEEELQKHREHLEELVTERTVELRDAQRALVSIVEDLDEKKKDLEAANTRLQELDRLKSMFIASMSHELRTPLNSIIGFTGIILQGMTGEINAEQRDQLQRVSRAGKHLLALITDVIDISKIEAGKVEAYVTEFPLDSVLNEAVSNLGLQIREKGLAIEVSMVPEKIILHTDRKRLFQCILNYLSNAVKFTEKGGVRVTAQRVKGPVASSQETRTLNPESRTLDADFIEISVEDTGIGIKEADMPMLFQSFVRLDSPLKTTVAGTGLGLYLTKKLAAEVLGGEVSARSTCGKGSAFMLRIPVRI